MNLTERIRDMRETGFADLLTRFGLQRRRVGMARFAAPTLALMGAAAAGWIAGLLYAPTTGRVQRRRLRLRLTAGRERAAGVVGEVRALGR